MHSYSFAEYLWLQLTNQQLTLSFDFLTIALEMVLMMVCKFCTYMCVYNVLK